MSSPFIQKLNRQNSFTFPKIGSINSPINSPISGNRFKTDTKFRNLKNTINPVIGKEKTSFLNIKDLKKEKLAIVSGAAARTSNAAILELLKNGFKVVGLSRNPERTQFNTKDLHFVVVDTNRINDPSYIKKMVEQGMQELHMKNIEKIVGLNLIGGPTAPLHQSLEYLNLELPLSFFKAVEKVAIETDRLSFVHISSIAATINKDQCKYAKVKNETDKAIQELQPKNGNNVVFRPDIVFPNPTEKNRVDTDHDFSPEQFNGRVIIVLGNNEGREVLQPLSQEDLYEAVANVAESNTKVHEIINAVGPQTISQLDMSRRFSKKNPFVIVVPLKFAKKLAEICPRGRFQTYAIDLIETTGKDPSVRPISTENFEKVLGRKPRGFDEIFNKEEQLIAAKAPVGKYAMDLMRTCVKHPIIFYNVSKAFVQSLPDWQIKKL